MIEEAIGTIVRKEHLTEQQAADVMAEIMGGEATEPQVAAFITALRMKGETVDEITGCARIMRKFATPIRVSSTIDVDREDINIDKETILDTCGTGGDGTCTFNISTATAIVIAAAGLTVAKHGNRSVSSACGSADVLEALGVNLNVTPDKVEECIRTIHIGFLFAPSLHGAMKYAVGPRRQIGIRTIFNILGSLTNPACANSQVLGVYSKDLTSLLVRVLKNLGTRTAWVVHGDDGLDEITVTTTTSVAELKNGRISEFSISPEQYGLRRAAPSEIKGGTAQVNAEIIRKLLKGEKGPRRDIVLLNAAAGLYNGGKAATIEEGITLAAHTIDSGAADATLAQLVKMTHE
jgi:anthranilate phosphoribosyltransferase